MFAVTKPCFFVSKQKEHYGNISHTENKKDSR
jgi:hypothetical protein